MPKAKKLSNVTDLREKTVPGSKAKEPAKKPKKGFVVSWKKIVLGIIALILIVNGIFAYGVYALGWNGLATRTFLTVFPYPAATIKGGYVKISVYYKDLASYKKFFEVAKKTDFNSEEGQKEFKTLKENVLNQLITDEVVKKEAKKLKIKVEKNEVEEEYKKLVEKNGEETLKKMIKDYQNWSVGDLKAKIKQELLNKKLEDKIKEDESLTKSSKEKAGEILKRVKNGEDFATLAKEFSEDPSATEGGNLGWFGKGAMVQEFEDAAFVLNTGQVSEVIKTEFGYHIIKVNDKKENEVSASHILIKGVDFKEWLKQKEQEYKVKKLINLDKIKQ